MIDITKCPRDKEVDTWFNEEFERQKTREPLVLKDTPDADPAEVDAVMAEMLEDM